MHSEVATRKEASKSRLIYLSIKRTALGMAQALGLRKLQDYLQGCRNLSGSPVWILGVEYSAGEGGEKLESLPDEVLQEILEDFASRLWMTYRWDFPSLGEQNISTDAGWGCTLRSGQMLMAQALLHHVVGRGWRRKVDDTGETTSKEVIEIVQNFSDHAAAALSIHNICTAGRKQGVVAGEWLGPWVLSHVLESLVNSHRPYGLTAVVISQPGGGAPHINKARMNEYFDAFQDMECDGNVETQQKTSTARMSTKYPSQEFPTTLQDASCPEDSISSSRKQGSCVTEWELADIMSSPNLCVKPGLIVFIPLVLGVGKVDARYLTQLKRTMHWPQSLGIVGGRPSSSLYFMGYQDDHIIYLDPHEPQEIPEGEDVSSYFCSTLRHMSIASIDPSLTIGFYCKSKDDFQDLVIKLEELEQEVAQGAPLVTVTDNPDGSIPNIYDGDDGVLLYDSDSTSAEKKDEWELL